MDSARTYWPVWMGFLRRQGLTDLAAWFLEAAGPFNFLWAQLIYIGQPFVSSDNDQGLHALAHLLEQEDEARAFAALLKGQPQ